MADYTQKEKFLSSLVAGNNPAPYTRAEKFEKDLFENLPSGGGDLPTVSSADNGDVLTVVDGAWDKAAPSGSDLPVVSSADNGDVLTVVNGEWNKAEAPKELPTVTASDNGKVLGVANGTWSATNPSAASGLIVGSVDEGNYTRTLNKTMGEILSAYSAGKNVVIVETTVGEDSTTTEYLSVYNIETVIAEDDSYQCHIYAQHGDEYAYPLDYQWSGYEEDLYDTSTMPNRMV